MVNVEFVNPFVHATLNVFKTMVLLDVQREKPFLKKLGEPQSDISGTIGLAGQANGVVAIVFEKDVACAVTSSMLGEEFKELDDTVKDTMGELANMVAGGAKGIMTEKGFVFKIALPSVIVGDNHVISYPPGVPCMVIPFNIEKLGGKKFYVEVCLKSEG